MRVRVARGAAAAVQRAVVRAERGGCGLQRPQPPAAPRPARAPLPAPPRLARLLPLARRRIRALPLLLQQSHLIRHLHIYSVDCLYINESIFENDKNDQR